MADSDVGARFPIRECASAHLTKGLRFAVAAALSVVLWQPVEAHQAPTGWAYDPSCCSGRDCAPAAFNRVQVSRDGNGYHIRLRAGEHHHFPGAVDMIVPLGDRRIRPSQDTEYHICLSATGHLFCLYAPELGG